MKSYPALPMPGTDISFVSSGRPSIDRMFPEFYDYQEAIRTAPRLSNVSDYESNYSFESVQFGRNSLDLSSPHDFSYVSLDSDKFSNLSTSMVSKKGIKIYTHAQTDIYIYLCVY